MKLLPTLLITGVAALFGGSVSAQHPLSTREADNLTAFAKMYGYVRFFHPSDEASSISWDNFAVYGSQEVLKAKSNLELIQSLNQLFKPIAPAAVVYGGKEPGLPSIIPPDPFSYKVIAWQHKGVKLPNLGGKDNTYKSIRINRPLPLENDAADYLATYQGLDAQALQGKEFRYSGWLKVLSNEGGQGLLWIRVDKANGMGFFNNMADHPATENTWKQFSITGRIDADGQSLFLGSMLQGKGKVWFDGLKLEVREGDNWKEIPLKNAGFENHGDKHAPADWSFSSQASNYQIACVAEDAKEGKSSLLISSLAPAQSGILAQPLFAAYPQPGEYIRQTLIPGVSCTVPLALYGNSERTYPMADSMALSLLRVALNAQSPLISGDSLSTRLGAIVVSYSILRHFFPYWEDVAEKPDQWLHDGLIQAAAAKSADDFTHTLEWITASLNDGHIYVQRAGETPVHYPKVIFTRADGKIAVAAVLDENLKGTLQPGDVVTSVDGHPVEAYLTDLKKYISGSPQHKEYRGINKLGAGAPDSKLSLGILRDGKAFTVTAVRMANAQQHYRDTKRTSSMGWLQPGIFYIDLDREPMDSIRAHIQEIASAKSLICDLRGYPNSNHGLLQYLIKRKENAHWMFVPENSRPDFNGTTYAEIGWNLTPKLPHIKGKVFFLIDSRAISYAESYMGYVQDEHLATIIGAPTVGTNGNINIINLPGNYSFTFTGMLVKNHDGSKHHLRGIVPNVAVTPTLAGLAAGKDEILEKALQLATQK
ncbi:C-terminal processing protease CtpA/Prc [Chitinophaga dinghuensis]|uniref:C-terminal processing protease CtpA/Prc n=1 Tax=Chitinophaga dinghuensis TaxID=1539050 RepID=A0A327WDG4_9BACT|nr:S41 family peptidase [Chitinophaga dinghuensis]RAJ88168.1 C-terminal processing protease CtpA/Prc [Chitinophaga dinghuensis]